MAGKGGTQLQRDAGRNCGQQFLYKETDVIIVRVR